MTNLDLRRKSISDVGAQYLSNALKVKKTVHIWGERLALDTIGHLGDSQDLPEAMSRALQPFDAKGQHE